MHLPDSCTWQYEQYIPKEVTDVHKVHPSGPLYLTTHLFQRLTVTSEKPRGSGQVVQLRDVLCSPVSSVPVACSLS